jgi:GT2 family glycosyltransferase
MERVHLGVVLFENSPSELARLVRSLHSLEDAGLAVDVRFLDNSPGPGERRQAVESFGPDAYRAMEKNRGFGATHNIAMAEAFSAGAAAYVCVNPDAVLHPWCLRELWGTSLRPRTGLVDARTFPEEHPKPYDPGSGETPWCAGTVLLVPRETFEKVGAFDEHLFLYGEDVDLSWRVRAAGLVTRTAPGALALHWVEHRPLERNRKLEILRSAAYLGWKWGDPGFARRQERLYRHLTGESPGRTGREAPLASWKVADLRHGVRFARSRW